MPPTRQIFSRAIRGHRGSSLNVHPHYHLVVLERRVLRYFRRQGLLDELDAAGMLTGQGRS